MIEPMLRPCTSDEDEYCERCTKLIKKGTSMFEMNDEPICEECTDFLLEGAPDIDSQDA